MRIRIMTLGLLCGVPMVVPSVLLAYPNEERAVLDLSLSVPTSARLDTERQWLLLASGETLTVVDLATFAKVGASDTPYAIASDEDVNGSIQGLAISLENDQLYATQDGGALLIYDLTDLTEAPTRHLVSTGSNLTLVEYDSDRDELLMLNETNASIIRFSASEGQVLGQVPLTTTGSLTIAAMHYVPNIANGVGALYLTGTTGKLYLLPSGGSAVATVVLDVAGTDDLTGIAARPDSSIVYVINRSDKVLHPLTATNQAQLATIALGENSDMESIAVTDVTNPSGTYGFVVGSAGLSVFDTANNDLFDLGTTDDEDEPLLLSGSGPILAGDDGYLYVPFGKISVVSDNPFITVSTVEYSNGGTSMGSGESVALTFSSDEGGTYETRLGGDTTQNGSLIADVTGASSGSVTADTATTIIFQKDDSSLWDEGNNRFFLFVTDTEGNIGRRATAVTVDTPPPAVAISSVGFGNSKLYVNINRLPASDISTYRVYADTDPNVVAAKGEVAGTAAQSSSGTITVVVTGLQNGTTYYLAAEAVDSGGNVSVSRTVTLADGAVASGFPEATVGPVGLSGEAGCTLRPWQAVDGRQVRARESR